jgi:TRAP-type C4-dicarboxylate transport system substrate-binding protein
MTAAQRVRNQLNRREQMKGIVTICLVAAGLTITALPASAQTKLRIANWLPIQHPLFAEVIKPWTDEVTKATNGRVVMDVVTAPLGPPAAHFDFAVNGVADVTYGVHNYTPGRFTATLMAELPFQCEKAEYLSVAYWRIYEQYLAKANEHRGTKLLTVFTHGPGQIWVRGSDLTSMDSLKGAKIRIGGGFAQEAAKALGVVPIQAPVTQAYEILAGGAADGIEFPAESVTAFKIDKVLDQGLIVHGGLYTVSFFVVMNEAKWNNLSKQDQDAILSVSGEALARNAGKVWDKADAMALDTIKREGKVTLATPDKDQMAAIQAALQPHVASTLTQIAATGIDAATAYQALQREIAAIKGGH